MLSVNQPVSALAVSAKNQKRTAKMAKCGVCGGKISLTVVSHAMLCEDDVKAPPKTINDIKRENEEAGKWIRN